MHVIRVRNVNAALPAGLAYLNGYGLASPSRNGAVIVAPGPVTTVYDSPCERVLFWPSRDANPFFHFFEGLWMLAGRNDLAFLTKFVKRFKDYSDDGATLAGAYGQRWRQWPGGVKVEGVDGEYSVNCELRDQIDRVIELLKADPSTRRAVISMWDPNRDLFPAQGKDVCCNTQLMFTVSLGKANEPNRLNMMVTCRSNDIIWGAYGANAVHFTMLQEYLASRLGLVVGSFWQVSWNYHAYQEIYEKTCAGIMKDAGCPGLAMVDPEVLARGPLRQPNVVQMDIYERIEVGPYSMVKNPDTWDKDLQTFFTIADGTNNEVPHGISRTYDNPFFSEVARPLWWAHEAYQHKRWTQAWEILQTCQATDWRRAAREWIERRYAATRGGEKS